MASMSAFESGGCHRDGRLDGSEGGSTATTTSALPATVQEPHCKAAGLGDAALVKTWRPPEVCHWRGLAQGATTIIHSEVDLIAAALDCPASSGIDFAKSNVVVTGRALSPATVGIDAYDDGKKITFVSRQREPCPKEVPAMPITVPIAFLIPAGELRTFGDAMCTQHYKCP